MYPRVKRCADVAVSLVALLLLGPVMLLLAIWVRADSPGGALYRGERVGRGGRRFGMLKFRSMVADADRQGPSSTADDDPRITRSGAFLRRYKLDELPQLFNVLRGDMSFIGPRPQVPWVVDLYTEDERALLDVRPGITDYASIRYRNEGEILRGSTDPDGTYFEKIAPGKMRLGLHYVRTMSARTDIAIFVATAMAVLGADPNWCLPPESRDEAPAPAALGAQDEQAI
ncbi:MAG TPA: sugar transferase [Chthonomonadales bacterium]|nr:sugar transferase [Chthonomonadales bacterium]